MNEASAVILFPEHLASSWTVFNREMAVWNGGMCVHFGLENSEWSRSDGTWRKWSLSGVVGRSILHCQGSDCKIVEM